MSYLYEVKVTPELGRGLYAKSDIPKDTVLGQYEILPLSLEDTKLVLKTKLYFYTFAYAMDGKECLVLGEGSMFNHAVDNNVNYALIYLDNRRVMEYRTNQGVSAGAQLFINYDADKRYGCEFDSNDYVNHNLIG